jgi:cell division protease FtsH
MPIDNNCTDVALRSATNRAEVLDPALLRPGCFAVARPDKSSRQAILVVHVCNVKISDDVDLLKLAAHTSGFAAADLANVVSEAALLAARDDRQSVTMLDFEEAILQVLLRQRLRQRSYIQSANYGDWQWFEFTTLT